MAQVVDRIPRNSRKWNRRNCGAGGCADETQTKWNFPRTREALFCNSLKVRNSRTTTTTMRSTSNGGGEWKRRNPAGAVIDYLIIVIVRAVVRRYGEIENGSCRTIAPDISKVLPEAYLRPLNFPESSTSIDRLWCKSLYDRIAQIISILRVTPENADTVLFP